MKLKFYGAAGEVTGSCHILEANGHRVLLDCGLIQGGRKAEARNAEPFPFDPGGVDAVVLSHAHIDHSGRLPLLGARGFRGPIHCQNATADLCKVLLMDSAFLPEMDAKHGNRRRRRKGLPEIEPLYRQDDAATVLRQLDGHRYDERFVVAPGIEVRFREAGHILGSTSVELHVSEGQTTRTIVFSGDLGQYDTPILRDPAAIEDADLVIMESTYGGRHHRSRDETIRELGEILQEAAGSGNVMIPAFAVGRSQELLYQFGHHFDAWGMDRWNVFLDSPMAIEASEIYWNYPHLYDAEATKLRSENNRMPPLPNLHLTREAQESMAINRIHSGALIIAGSGMCTGGRILHHFKHNLWRSDCHVVIVGYQAHGSLGRRLVDGSERVRIHGETIRVAAKVHTIGGLSAHGDEDDLARWYGSMQSRPPVFVVHGEPEAGAALAGRLKREFGCRVDAAEPGLEVDLEEL
ncbi:MAG: MBL fold metallo-hydrolase [Pseudomonadota bacterium]